MEENKICMMCGETLHADEGFYPANNGDCAICDTCAARYTFKTLFTRAENTNGAFPFTHVFETPIEATAIQALEPPEDGGPEESSVDVLKDMKAASGELQRDIEELSQDDFLSKYVDRPDAIDAYINAHPESV